MNDGRRKMDNWRRDIRQRLVLLHDSLCSPNASSEKPAYVLETLASNVQNNLLTELDAESIGSLVLGALRMIGDTGNANDDDPIVRQLLEIHQILASDDR